MCYINFARSLFFVLLSMSVLSGCAYFDRFVCLEQSSVALDAKQQLNGRTVHISGKRSAVQTNANGLWIIGALNDAEGMPQAELLTSTDPLKWITVSIATELSQEGFSVSIAPDAPSDSMLNIIVSDLDLSMNINRDTGTAEIANQLKFDVEFAKDTRASRSLTVRTQNQHRMLTTYSGKYIQKLMQQTLQDGIRQIIPEVRRQLGLK